jgi:hypothetical protein
MVHISDDLEPFLNSLVYMLFRVLNPGWTQVELQEQRRLKYFDMLPRRGQKVGSRRIDGISSAPTSPFLSLARQARPDGTELGGHCPTVPPSFEPGPYFFWLNWNT